MTFDVRRLIKILNLTTSSNDGEALAALRRAIEIMVKHSLTWEHLLAPTAEACQPLGFGFSKYEADSAKFSPHKMEEYLTKIRIIIMDGLLPPRPLGEVQSIQFDLLKYGRISSVRSDFIDGIWSLRGSHAAR